jgi:hypothetical protein
MNTIAGPAKAPPLAMLKRDLSAILAAIKVFSGEGYSDDCRKRPCGNLMLHIRRIFPSVAY